MKNKSFFATLVFIVIFGIGIILAYSMNKVSIGIGKTMLSDMLEGRDKMSNLLQKIIDDCNCTQHSR